MENNKINNEKQLFELLTDPNTLKNLQNIEVCQKFINSIEFSLKIEGKTSNGDLINGHVTTDLLGICNAWQNTVYSIYAIAAKGKDDARGKVLTKQEREKLTLIFKIENGSTKEIAENLPQVINALRDMPVAVQLTIIGAIVIAACGGIYFLISKNNNDAKKFLAQNATLDNAIKALEKTTIEALNSPKLQIETATIGGKQINMQQIQERFEEMNGDESYTEDIMNAKFVVTKLYHKGIKKMATLTNKDFPSIDVSFKDNLFEGNENRFMVSFSSGAEIDCEVYIQKDPSGLIKKATLLKLND